MAFQPAAAQPRQSTAMSFFGAIAQFFDSIADAQNRSSEVQRLQRLSDRQLADLGVGRADIVRYVYRDIYHV